MPPPKKMQVFVSSTYTDLKSERQAAVEAILTAGHIPAGMELFAAGDQSQMDVIRHWIDESDVFLLILGGRYGSLDPLSSKSYVHLEYDYAVASAKPVFAVVIEAEHLDVRVRAHGTAVIETDNASALRQFREVVTSRVVRFWRDPRDIKLAILETLPEFARRPTIEGWVRALSAVDLGPVTEEVTRLSRENAGLREQLASSGSRTAMYNGLSFEEFYDLLAHTSVPRGLSQHDNWLNGIVEVFGDKTAGLLHAFWMLSGRIAKGVRFLPDEFATAQKLEEFGLIVTRESGFSEREFQLTPAGRQFLLRLRQSRNLNVAEELRL